jgi:hypothetical protein
MDRVLVPLTVLLPDKIHPLIITSGLMLLPMKRVPVTVWALIFRTLAIAAPLVSTNTITYLTDNSATGGGKCYT